METLAFEVENVRKFLAQPGSCILIVRHAESRGVEASSPLTPLGERQAAKLRHHARNLGVVRAAFSSGRERAIQSATDTTPPWPTPTQLPILERVPVSPWDNIHTPQVNHVNAELGKEELPPGVVFVVTHAVNVEGITAHLVQGLNGDATVDTKILLQDVLEAEGFQLRLNPEGKAEANFLGHKDMNIPSQ